MQLTVNEAREQLERLRDARLKRECPNDHRVECLCAACLYFIHMAKNRRSKLRAENFLVGWIELFFPEFGITGEEVWFNIDTPCDKGSYAKEPPWAIQGRLNRLSSEEWEERYIKPVFDAAMLKVLVADKIHSTRSRDLTFLNIAPYNSKVFKIIQKTRRPIRYRDLYRSLKMRGPGRDLIPSELDAHIRAAGGPDRLGFSVKTIKGRGPAGILFEPKPISGEDLQSLVLDNCREAQEYADSVRRVVLRGTICREDTTCFNHELLSRFREIIGLPKKRKRLTPRRAYQ